jgi:Ca-activated chloride channel family protein
VKPHALTAALLAILALGSGSTIGRGFATLRQPPYRVSVDAVALNVTATDGSNRYVSDLGRDDFLVFEDGRQQELTFFQKTGAPLSVALLLDSSASMDRTLALAQDAAAGFARALVPGDSATVIDFNRRVTIAQPSTAAVPDLERAIKRTRVGGSTALYNALYIAMKELSKGASHESPTETRRVVVVLSDGDDTSSIVTFEEVLEVATRLDTAVYAIGLLGQESRKRGRKHDAKFVLRELAHRTGGRSFFPNAAEDFAAIYREIREELTNQYALAYESDNPRRDGQFRRIAVRIARPGIVARTRAGYYAPAR